MRLLSTETLTLAQALRWLMRRGGSDAAYRGRALTGIQLLHYTGGAVVRVSYGRTTVWTYGRVIPPSLIASRTPGKTIPLAGGIGGFYSTIGGLLVGERSIPAGGTVAVAAPGNASTYSALGKAEADLVDRVASRGCRRAASTWSPRACAPTRPT